MNSDRRIGDRQPLTCPHIATQGLGGKPEVQSYVRYGKAFLTPDCPQMLRVVRRLPIGQHQHDGKRLPVPWSQRLPERRSTNTSVCKQSHGIASSRPRAPSKRRLRLHARVCWCRRPCRTTYRRAGLPTAAEGHGRRWAGRCLHSYAQGDHLILCPWELAPIGASSLHGAPGMARSAVTGAVGHVVVACSMT